jgi:hypothetical protein
MSRAARTVFVFGIYLVGTGALLLVAPNVLLGLLRIAPATEPWIRVLGMIVALLGAYYIVAARAELSAFFRASVAFRLFALVGFGGLAAVGWAPATLIGFGVIDALAALWTRSALRAAA